MNCANISWQNEISCRLQYKSFVLALNSRQNWHANIIIHLLTEMYFTKESLDWWINLSDTITMQRTPELALSSFKEKQ